MLVAELLQDIELPLHVLEIHAPAAMDLLSRKDNPLAHHLVHICKGPSTQKFSLFQWYDIVWREFDMLPFPRPISGNV
jgi:hypothetical protein